MELMTWINNNAGVVSVLIFIVSLIIGWFSGILKFIAKPFTSRPQFQIEALPGPTICSTFLTGKKFNNYDVHQTGISLYLKITNIGNRPSSVNKIKAGFHWHLRRFNLLWVKYTLGWFWLDLTVSLCDFMVDIGENVKVFPFLLQKSYLSPNMVDTYLEVGKSAIGVVYFEQQESWGGCFPTPKKGHTKIKIKIIDSFGGVHAKVIKVPIVDLEKAKQYCPAFGETYRELNSEKSNQDTPRKTEAKPQTQSNHNKFPFHEILMAIAKYHSQEIPATPSLIAQDLGLDAEITLAHMWKYHNEQFITFRTGGAKPGVDTPFFLSPKAMEHIKITIQKST